MKSSVQLPNWGELLAVLRRPEIVGALGVIVAVSIVAIVLRIDVDRLTRDPAAIYKAAPMLGVLSVLGVLVWTAVAAVCGMVSWSIADGDAESAGAFRFASALAAYIALDDQFQLHEWFWPGVVGVPEVAVYALLGGALSYLLVRYRHFWRDREPTALALGIAMLAASVLLDAVEDRLWRLGAWYYLIEDGAKWLGIVLWASWWIREGRRALIVPAGTHDSRGPASSETPRVRGPI